jgi:hypothetical protein
MVNLEQVMFLVEDSMNNNSAVQVHVVIVYEKELVSHLSKMSSTELLATLDQLVKDHPDKTLIVKWDIVAKKRISKWINIPKIEKDHLTAQGGFVFASYSSPGDHRAVIPSSCKKLKIKLKQTDFETEPVPGD